MQWLESQAKSKEIRDYSCYQPWLGFLILNSLGSDSLMYVSQLRTFLWATWPNIFKNLGFNNGCTGNLCGYAPVKEFEWQGIWARLVQNSRNGYRPALNSKNLTKKQVYRIDYFTSERISSHLYTIVLLFLPDPYSVQKGDSSFYWDTQSFIYCASMGEKQKLAGENDLTKILIQIPHHITIS